MEKISVRDARNSDAVGQQATLQGWVRTRRDSKGGFSFLELNDGSCMANIQIVVDGDVPNYESEVKRLSAGCSVTIRGEIKPSQGKGQTTEVQAAEVVVHGWADPEEYPLQKKRHSFEKLREWAHLRPRTNTFGAVARVRSELCTSIHDFFRSRDFLCVQTPIITASDCEGAGEMFRVTSLDLANVPKTADGAVDFAQDFFDRPSYLTVSGQLEGEIYATALGKVYTFGPTFRAENSNTARHLAEFWMIEPEMAFCDLEANMDLAESFLRYLSGKVLDSCAEDLQFFNDRIDDGLLERLNRMIDKKPFARITYTEAVDLLEKSGEKFEYPVEWGTNLQAEHERFLAEKEFKCPVIVYDYPATIKPFYMRISDDGKTVAAMDVLMPGVGEIIGGSQREERLDVLKSRMEAQGLDPDEYWWYLDLRRFGTVPHSGFGLGLERMVQFVTGMANIRDVIPFPRTPGNADF